MSTQEQQLCQFLARLPAECNYQYTETAARKLLENLFWSLCGGNQEYLRLMFPEGKLNDSLKMSDAQGAVEGAEYTEAARGKRCGHIFKQGEATYACRTCGTDETCCLCSRCFDSTDHTGHMVRMHISVGNSGCCDCGDEEAWKTPVFCTIHSDMDKVRDKGKGKASPGLPENLVANLQMTIARVFDYMCDVISCSPEQLRQTKTEESVLKDEETSRLLPTYYGQEPEACNDFSLVLWNDEKHTVREVKDQVARACSKRLSEAMSDAWDVDSHGRTILASRTGVTELLSMAETIESIRITVTIRSSRDTFREQMCGTIVEWLGDIAGCAVGDDNHVLRLTVCEELMRPWRKGSPATHIDGLIDDEDEDDLIMARRRSRAAGTDATFLAALRQIVGTGPIGLEMTMADDDDDDDDMDDDDGRYSAISGEYGDEDEDDDDDDEDEDVMMVDAREDVNDVGLGWSQSDQALEEDEATMAGYPPPPPPPPAAGGRASTRQRDATPSDSDTGAEPLIAPALFAKTDGEIPKTPGRTSKLPAKPGKYWIETPAAYTRRDNVHPAEDVFQRVRLDWLLLFDLRMWKRVRIDLRALYISTVVQVPEFKRLLALRFSSLYTILAQLYLVGDREPDHSIINLSLQMLTTPSITAEIVERGNFMTSLLAILYTFLTSRQVGHPWDISPDAVMGFESGSVTNRRMYHFYQDLKYLFGSPHVQERIRYEPRYLMQFLDLVKLHQGIGPNIRAITEHVEYETESWITASLVTRQINVQARGLAEAFRNCSPEDLQYLQRAIRLTARTAILYSIGAERFRFRLTEVKDEIQFKHVVDYEMAGDSKDFKVVKFLVEKDAISFHHALHYTLSWLIEHARSMSASEIKSLLSFTLQELRTKNRLMGRIQLPKEGLSPEDYLMAAFDFPLRVCAWLAQIKANMWVRNGISLRHQASTYRGVSQRDLAHHRDIFLLQTAMVVCNQERVLASIIDRFGMDSWVKGFYELKSEAQDDHQHLDVVEDMLHLLIILLSDRTCLLGPDDESRSRLLAMRRDLIHVLCFKPMSFNEIGNKLPEKYQESEDFQRILDEMATYKPPEGISDVGMFELRAEFIEEIDPYIAHYNKNQREESEMAYRKKMAKKTGKSVEEIVYEPRPRPLRSGLFEHLATFTGTGVFAQIIYYCLLYPIVYNKMTPTIPSTRIETYLQVVLHLVLLAIHEDTSEEVSADAPTEDSFVFLALTRVARTNLTSDDRSQRTIIALLNMLSAKDEFKSAHPKIALVMKRLKQKRPHAFETAFHNLGISVDRVNTASPSINSVEEERERKKKAALSRQARVMEQFQLQQKSFMENQRDIDWGSDLEEDDEDEPLAEDRSHTWKYPTGTCILCQEAADDRRLYGTFAMFNESRILRQTDFTDADMVREASQTPCSLDRSADDIRPFGISRENRKMVAKYNSQGETFLSERQTIGKGFPADMSRPGPVASGCGHMMHWRCFEMYFEATKRRHQHQIARHHPEDIKRNEFVCPLCKALGNAFLPIVWKGLDESYPAYLQPRTDFAHFMEKQAIPLLATPESKAREVPSDADPDLRTPSFPGSLIQTLSGPNTASESTWGAAAPDSGPESVLRSQMARTDDPETAHMQQAMLRAWGQEVGAASSRPLIAELFAAYARLRDTLEENSLLSRRERDPKSEAPKEIGYSNSLVQSVGFSISAAEIQQRGVESQPGLTLLEKIPEQVLTHLRVLSETAASYIAAGMSKESTDERVSVEFRRDSERQCSQLLTPQRTRSGASDALQSTYLHPPLLSLDPFIFFVECTYGLVPAHKLDVAHILRLCYLAEITKVVYHMCRNMSAQSWVQTLGGGKPGDPAIDNFGGFATAIGRYTLLAQTLPSRADQFDQSAAGFDQPGVDTLEGWYSFTKKYALTFLRKSLLLMNVKYGVAFNSQFSANPDAEELERLTEILGVPSFDNMCAAVTSNSEASGWPEVTKQLVEGWIWHDLMWSEADPVMVESAKVSHPGIFELVGLPKTYDTLIEEATRRRCPTRGKDLTDPTLCLFCGEFFCGQATCCQKAVQLPGGAEALQLGGAQQHMLKYVYHDSPRFPISLQLLTIYLAI